MDFLANHIKEDNDAFILFDGYEGSGKSNFSQQQGRYLAEVNGIEVSAEPVTEDGNIVYAGQVFEDFMQGAKVLPEYSPIWADELQWLAFSRNSRKADQRLLIQVLQTIRDKHFAFFACLPKRHWADIYIRGHRTQFWWWIYTQPYVDARGGFHYRKGFADFQQGMESKWEPIIKWTEVAKVVFPPPDMNDHFWKKYQERKKEFRERVIDALSRGKTVQEGYPQDQNDSLIPRQRRLPPKDPKHDSI